MSLAVVFKGAEGVVLAADSRVTLTAIRKVDGKDYLLPSTYDNATKLLNVPKQTHVGVVTYGLGAIGQQEPRTAHSYLPEFERVLVEKNLGRLSTEDFARELGAFFLDKWKSQMPTDYRGDELIFLVGGYDEGAVYGKIFEVKIPSKAEPVEYNADSNFGIVWGGQEEYTSRLLNGYDQQLLRMVEKELTPPSGANKEVAEAIAKAKASILASLKQLGTPIPYQFLPLQDAVDLLISLVRITITIQKWLVGIRGVGGSIDVAVVTQRDGFQPVQQKRIKGE